MIDSEWPLLNAAFEAWLSPDNFSMPTAHRSGGWKIFAPNWRRRRRRDRAEKKKDRSPAIAAAIILVVVGVGFFMLPSIMLWLGDISPWLGGVFGVVFVLGFFLIFWLRARHQRKRGL